jgi:two-component system response regulator
MTSDTDNQYTILLVEDNDDDYDLALRAFRKSGLTIQVDRASDGSKALDYLTAASQADTLPRLILLDLNLPSISGHEVLRHVRSVPTTRYLPVVVLTTSREDEDLARCYDLGANSYIRKPVDFVEFTTAVQTVAQYWLRLNEPYNGR